MTDNKECKGAACSDRLQGCGRCELQSDEHINHAFDRYYETGQRVEVTWANGHGIYMGYGCRTDGKKSRFYVGKSTGWRPCYIMLLRKDSTGGMALDRDNSHIEEVKPIAGMYKC